MDDNVTQGTPPESQPIRALSTKELRAVIDDALRAHDVPTRGEMKATMRKEIDETMRGFVSWGDFEDTLDERFLPIQSSLDRLTTALEAFTALSSQLSTVEGKVDSVIAGYARDAQRNAENHERQQQDIANANAELQQHGKDLREMDVTLHGDDARPGMVHQVNELRLSYDVVTNQLNAQNAKVNEMYAWHSVVAGAIGTAWETIKRPRVLAIIIPSFVAILPTILAAWNDIGAGLWQLILTIVQSIGA